MSNKLCSFQYENTSFGPGHPGHPGHPGQIRSSRSSRLNWIVGSGPGPGPGKIEIIGPGPGPGKLIISVPVPVPVPVRPEIMSRSITELNHLPPADFYKICLRASSEFCRHYTEKTSPVTLTVFLINPLGNFPQTNIQVNTFELYRHSLMELSVLLDTMVNFQNGLK